MELIHQAMSGNHKVLLFSQFTSVFPILEKRLMQEKIPYYELTGQTSKEKRMQLTEQFNSGDVPIFLISLKAGGTSDGCQYCHPFRPLVESGGSKSGYRPGSPDWAGAAGNCI